MNLIKETNRKKYLLLHIILSVHLYHDFGCAFYDIDNINDAIPRLRYYFIFFDQRLDSSTALLASIYILFFTMKNGHGDLLSKTCLKMACSTIVKTEYFL